ncbi:MAG: phosphoenolpyruvate synthase [Chloroflexi bacterium]|nr:phosphoenolpyruvate synthase [Chloroflexota bacterium]
MDTGRRVVVWFEEVDKTSIGIAGGKGANLGEMLKSGINVPGGFIVTADAYCFFVDSAGIRDSIQEILTGLDESDSERLQEAGEQVKQLITSAPMPREIAEAVRRSYRKMGGGRVAVRSSATAEDLPDASFAGQQRTYLNVVGEEAVLVALQGCWASLFEPRAIFYRIQHGFDHFKVNIAVPVQKMVQSEVSGVMFTLDPLTNDRSKVVIEAVYGLGEAIVSGEVTPDLYTVDKDTMTIVDKQVRPQEWHLIANPDRGDGLEANIKATVPLVKQNMAKLADGDILALARMAKRIEEHYKFPQDIEWGREGPNLFILQSRPVTTTGTNYCKDVPHLQGNILLTGVAACPGIASGQVRVIPSPSQIHKIKPGEILVAEMTTPDYVPAMKKAAAIITDRGGRTAHAAIVSRELGIPCVVGTSTATGSLVDGQMVTVDGYNGKVYDGQLADPRGAAAPTAPQKKIATRTRIYVNLADPDLVERVAAMDCDGVGLLRAEFIIAHHIGEHPRYLLKHNRGKKFTDKMADALAIFAKGFYPRPVIYRTTDFKTNEYRSLKGGREFEDQEENPMIGYRGASRYVNEADILSLEVQAIRRVRESYPNLYVMIPFVRTVKEMVDTKRLLEAEGLRQSDDFKLWMMAEIPANVFLIDEFLATGIDGVSIGSNDMTQLVLGIDRDNQKLADKFDERNEAVTRALERVIVACSTKGKTVSICGQAPSVYPELTEKLVRWGITSVSVSPDMIDTTRQLVADVEARLAKSQRLRAS